MAVFAGKPAGANGAGLGLVGDNGPEYLGGLDWVLGQPGDAGQEGERLIDFPKTVLFPAQRESLAQDVREESGRSRSRDNT
jgi:hypothetical protein